MQRSIYFLILYKYNNDHNLRKEAKIKFEILESKKKVQMKREKIEEEWELLSKQKLEVEKQKLRVEKKKLKLSIQEDIVEAVDPLPKKSGEPFVPPKMCNFDTLFDSLSDFSDSSDDN